MSNAESNVDMSYEGPLRPALQVSIHELKLQNQTIYLDPPIEQARESLYRQFHDWLGTSNLTSDGFV